MRANSKVAILVVSMFVLTALAPAVTVFCGSDTADAADVELKGVNNSEAAVFTDSSSSYGSLVYLSDKFPVNSGQDIVDWAYDSVKGYWVNINEKSDYYGKILTYEYFAMSTADIRQDIVDKYYRDNMVNENGVKYIVSGSTIRVGTEDLVYSKSGDDITIGLGSMTVEAIYDLAGRNVTSEYTGPYDSFTVDYDGVITVKNAGAAKVNYVSKLTLSIGGSVYNIMRNVDQATARFQILQATFKADSSCMVNITVTKTNDSLNKSEDIAADMTFADCYFSELQYARLYVIDSNNGDLRPIQTNGTYSVVFTDKTNGTGESKDVKVGNSLHYIYGTVVDAEGSKSGASVTNPLYGAKVTYSVIKENGEMYTSWDTVSSVTDDSGQVAGFFRMEVEYGAKIQVNDVECEGYSFNKYGKSYNVEVTSDLLPKDSDCVFKADEKTVTVTVNDLSGEPAANCKIKAQFWYQYGSNTISTEYPTSATGSEGSLPVKDFVTDENGQAKISYSAPTGVDNYALLVQCVSEKDDVYTFNIDDTSTWSSKTVIPELTKEGNVYIASMHATTGTAMFAKEYSFTVNVKTHNDGERALADAGITVNWYYRGVKTTDKNSTKMGFDPTGGESAGKVKVASSATDASGAIKLVYSVPVFEDIRWTDNISSAFIYLYGTGYTFDYVKNITDLTYDPVVTGHDGCIKLDFTKTTSPSKYSDDGPYKILSEDNLYIISGEITPASTADVPYAVRMVVSFFESGTPSTIDQWFYRSNTSSKIEYSFSMIGGRTPIIKMFSDGYSFTSVSPSVGTINSDKTVNFISDKNATSEKRIASVPIGITTGYVVSTVEAYDIIRYTYIAGGSERSVLVRALSLSVTYVPKGKAGLDVYMTAADTEEKYHISEFDASGNATTVRLKSTSNLMYKDTTAGVTPLSGYIIDVYYKDEPFCKMTSDSNGVAKIKIPVDETNVKYYCNDYPIVADSTPLPSGKYAGYYTFNIGDYVPKNVSRSITVTIEYYATSSIDNLSGATCKQIVYDDSAYPTMTEITVGSQKTFIAPTLDGFDFAGWYFDGQYYSDSDKKACSFTALGEMEDNVTLRAYYSAKTVEEPDKGIDSTVMIIGIIAIVVAVLALVYVVFQSKRF